MATAQGPGAVAIAGDNYADIKIAVTTTQSALADLLPTEAELTDRYERLGVASYSRRPWLEDLVDSFLTGDGGYLLIEAAAGMGKSVFAAVQARERGCPAYFPERTKVETRTTVVARRQLIAQLLDRWELTPDGRMPGWAEEAHGLTRALRAAAAKRDETSPGSPVLVVVDGLDEFIPSPEERASGNPVPYGLPVDLPPGVFMLATTRSGAHLGPLRRRSRVCDWRDHAEANRADMRRYLSGVIARGDFAAATPLPNGFVDTLVDRCGGLWLYLRFVQRQIHLGHRDPATVAHLPEKLEEYFHEAFAAMRERDDWDELMRPLLGALAAALEPLAYEQLAAFTAAHHPHRVRRLLLEPLRPFLWIGGTDSRFALYHDSLRAFIATSDEDWFRRELAEATTAAHHGIADHYLTAWGGLSTGLERLARETVEPDGYGLRAVVTHLATADRLVDVHRLLACEHHGRNVWHTVRDRRHDLPGYLRDIDVAASLAADTAALLRYRLITASVTSQATKVPAGLVAAMVDAGMWTPANALDLAARGMPDKEVTDLLRTLASRLTDEQGARALEIVARFTDDEPRCAALTALVPHLPAAQLDRVLDMASAVGPEIDRRIALEALGRHCDDDLKPALIEEIRRLESPAYRAEALSKVVPHLSRDLRAAALAAQHAAVADVTYPPYRVITTGQLAQHTAPAESAALIRDALALIRGMDVPDRFAALAQLALFVPEQLRGEVLDEARQAPPRQKVDILAALARQSTGADAATLLEQALRIALTLDDREQFAAMGELMPQLPAAVPAAIAAAGRQDAPYSLVKQARTADRYLDGAAHDEVFDRIWQGCLSLSEDWEQHLVVQDWAHRFPSGPVLEMIRSWRLPRFRVDGLVTLAQNLPDERRWALLREAYSIASELGDVAAQAAARAALLPHLSAPLRAAATAALVADAERSPNALLTALRQLPATVPERPRLGERALDRADSAHEYVELAPLLPDVFGRLLDGVARIPDPWRRLTALLGVAGHVPPAHLDRYVEVARGLGRDGVWVVGRVSRFEIEPLRFEVQPELSGLVTVLPHGIHAGPLAAALAHPAIGPELARELRAEVGEALEALAQRLSWPEPGDLLLRSDLGAGAMLAVAPYSHDANGVTLVITAGQVLSFRWTTAEALTALAPTLDVEQQERLVRDALRLYESIPLAWDRNLGVQRGLGALLEYLPEADRHVATRRWLTAVIRDCKGCFNQAGGLREIAPHLPDDLLPVAADAAASIHDYRQPWEADARADALAALAEVWRGDPTPLQAAIAALPDPGHRAAVLAARLRSGTHIPVRDWPAPTTRAVLLKLIEGAADALRDDADDVFQGVQDVTRWWP